MTFDNPEAISATSESDFLQINFNYKGLFKNPNGAVLKTNRALKIFPSLFKRNFDSVEQFVKSNSATTTAITFGTAITNVSLSTSLSLLWTLINVLQILVCLPLVDVNYPANALNFNKIFIAIANFEILPVASILKKTLKFGP